MSRIAAVILVAVAGVTALFPPLTAGARINGAAAIGEPRTGFVYEATRGRGALRIVRIGTSSEARPLLLAELAPTCGGFQPEARLVMRVTSAGKVKAHTRAFDHHTTDSVDATIDVSGTVGAAAANLVLRISLKAGDNAGPTGSCDQMQSWTLQAGGQNAAASLISGATAAAGDSLVTGNDGVFIARTRNKSKASRVQRIDPTTLTVSWTATTDGSISELAAAGDAAWVFDAGAAELTRLNAATGQVVTSFILEPDTARRAGTLDTPLAATDRAVWVAIDAARRVYRIDAGTNAVTARIDMDSEPIAIVANNSGAHVAIDGPNHNVKAGRIERLSDTGVQLASVAVAGDSVTAMALSETDLWALTRNGSVLRYDAVTLVLRDRVDGIKAVFGTRHIAAVQSGVWVAGERGLIGVVSAGNREVPLVGAGSRESVAGFGSVWVLDAGYLVRIGMTG